MVHVALVLRMMKLPSDSACSAAYLKAARCGLGLLSAVTLQAVPARFQGGSIAEQVLS